MAQQDDCFFNIPCSYQIYAEPLHAPASEELLMSQMPEAFKLLRNIAEQEQNVFLHISQLPKGDIISEYLMLQAKKVDLVLHQQLAQIDYRGMKCQGTHFGGSHLSFSMPEQFRVNDAQELALHLLIQNHNIAVYCFAKVLSFSTENKQHSIRAEIVQIGEAEQEQLIRASLQQQQHILKSRKKH
tara:strand:+ start:889 stop:1443 length:555 start_codon:yes stop_codon:yes gene_type:complete